MRKRQLKKNLTKEVDKLSREWKKAGFPRVLPVWNGTRWVFRNAKTTAEEDREEERARMVALCLAEVTYPPVRARRKVVGP